MRCFDGQLATQPAAADGSCYVQHGNTKVVCTVTGPAEASMRTRQLHDRASVTVEVTYAAFSGAERKRRGRNDKYPHLPSRETAPLLKRKRLRLTGPDGYRRCAQCWPARSPRPS